MKKLKTYKSSIIAELLNEVTPLEKIQALNKLIVAARIEDLLTEKGWTKTELKERACKNSLSEITKWLSGTQNLTLDTLTEIAFVFNISITELFEPVKSLNKPKTSFAKPPMSTTTDITSHYEPQMTKAVILGRSKLEGDRLLQFV